MTRLITINEKPVTRLVSTGAGIRTADDDGRLVALAQPITTERLDGVVYQDGGDDFAAILAEAYNYWVDHHRP